MADGFAVRRSVAAAIDAAVAERSMLKHRFYQAWEAGELSMDTLRVYARQYFHHVEAFPQVVSAAHAQCPDPAGRRLLAENLAEEEGLANGTDDHATLWMHFAEGLGAAEADVRGAKRHAETQALIDTFRTLSRRSYAAGLGALYAYESQLPNIASTKIEGLVSRYHVSDARTLRFFEVHKLADIEHSAVCRKLLDALPADQQAEAIAAGAELAEALLSFLDGMARETGLN
jgi:pyrroloquinoline-quinone synthase